MSATVVAVTTGLLVSSFLGAGYMVAKLPPHPMYVGAPLHHSRGARLHAGGAPVPLHRNVHPRAEHGRSYRPTVVKSPTRHNDGGQQKEIRYTSQEEIEYFPQEEIEYTSQEEFEYTPPKKEIKYTPPKEDDYSPPIYTPQNSKPSKRSYTQPSYHTYDSSDHSNQLEHGYNSEISHPPKVDSYTSELSKPSKHSKHIHRSKHTKTHTYTSEHSKPSIHKPAKRKKVYSYPSTHISPAPTYPTYPIHNHKPDKHYVINLDFALNWDPDKVKQKFDKIKQHVKDFVWKAEQHIKVKKSEKKYELEKKKKKEKHIHIQKGSSYNYQNDVDQVKGTSYHYQHHGYNPYEQYADEHHSINSHKKEVFTPAYQKFLDQESNLPVNDLFGTSIY